MPLDLMVISPLQKLNASPDYLRGTGSTDFIFEPYENDIQFDKRRQIRTFSGTAKLTQAIMRAVMSIRGEYFEDPNWGADINTTIGSKLDIHAYSTVRQSVIDALTHYNELNQDNPNSDEVIDTIDELAVVLADGDPRTIKVVIGITTESGQSIKVVAPQVDK